MEDAPKFDDTIEIEDTPSFDETEEFVSELPEDAVEVKDSSVIETVIKKGLQGASFGLLDEVKGGLEAVGSKVGLRGLGGEFKDIRRESEAEDKQSFLDVYRQARDEARTREKQLEEENPNTALVSELAGGFLVPGAAVARGAGKGAKMGSKMLSGAKEASKMGALGSAGYTESDLSKGELEEFTKDVAKGTAQSALLGASLPLAGKALNSIKDAPKNILNKLSDTELGDTFNKVRKATKEGTKFFGKTQKDIIKNDADELAQKVQDRVLTELDELRVDFQKVYKGAEKSQAAVDIRNKVKGVEKFIKSAEKNLGPEDAEKLKNVQSILDRYKQQTKIMKGEDQALKKLTNLKNKYLDQARQLGDDVRFTPDKVNPDTGYASSVMSYKDAQGNPVSKVIQTPVNKDKVITEFTSSIPEKFKTKEVTNIIKSIDSEYESASRPVQKYLARIRKDFDKLRESSIDGQGKLVEELKDVNNRFGNIKKLEEANLLPKSFLDGTDQAEEAITVFSNQLRKMELDGVTPERLKVRLDNIKDKLEVIDSRFAREFEKKADSIAKRFELNNLTGSAFDSLGLTSLARSAATVGGSVVGTTQKKVGDVIKNMSKMTPQSFKNIADKLDETGSSFGRVMRQLSETEDMSKKNALMFTLMQQQAFKEDLKKSGMNDLVSEIEE